MNEKLIHLRTWGDFACFTRPEMKVERVSYPLITPSAARGILEAIFWKPEMFYLIDSIRVIRKGIWTSFRRNEVTKRISLRQAKSAISGTGEISTIKAGGGAEDATQRNMLALKDVEYVISAEIRLTELGAKTGDTAKKYVDEFSRRAKSGKCFHRPALGVREFSADFLPVDDPTELRPEMNWSENLGLMLYDVFSHNERSIGFKFLNDSDLIVDSTGESGKRAKKKKSKTPVTQGHLVAPAATFFNAEIKDSVMDCLPERVEIIHPSGGAN